MTTDDREVFKLAYQIFDKYGSGMLRSFDTWDQIYTDLLEFDQFNDTLSVDLSDAMIEALLRSFKVRAGRQRRPQEAQEEPKPFIHRQWMHLYG